MFPPWNGLCASVEPLLGLGISVWVSVPFHRFIDRPTMSLCLPTSQGSHGLYQKSIRPGVTLFPIVVLFSFVVFEIAIAIPISFACQLCTPTQCGPGTQDPHRSRVAFRGTWVAQWVKASAFSSGHDPRVLGSSPVLGSLLSREPASPSLCLPFCLLVISLSLCQISE